MAESDLTKAAARQQGRATPSGSRRGAMVAGGADEAEATKATSATMATVVTGADPRGCVIRALCRWRAQGGDAVCASCRHVVTQDAAPAAGPTMRSVV